MRWVLKKISVNTSAINNPALISQASALFGSQSTLVTMDIKKAKWGKGHYVWSDHGQKKLKIKTC